MKLKKYFKRFWLKHKPDQHEKHHRRKKAAIFWDKFIRILTIKFVALVTIILFFFYFGVAYAQAPIHELINRINKPKPITQSSSILSPSTQKAITDEAKNQINEEQAKALLATN